MRDMKNELPIGNWMKASEVLSYLPPNVSRRVEQLLNKYLTYGYYETSLLRRCIPLTQFQQMECNIATYMVFATGKSPCPNCGAK